MMWRCLDSQQEEPGAVHFRPAREPRLAWERSGQGREPRATDRWSFIADGTRGLGTWLTTSP